MPKRLPIKAMLNRMLMRDDQGRPIEGGARPYQFELLVGRMRLTGVWLNNTDERSEEYFKRFVESLTGRDDIETEIKG